MASVKIGISKYRYSKKTAEILMTLKTTGEKAGAKKCFSEFKTPIASAARDTKKMYGNII